MKSKPPKCYEVGCPLAVLCSCGHHLDLHPDEGHCTHMKEEVLCECRGFQSKGLGFVLGVGDPKKAKLGIVLEAPGKEEVGFPLDGLGAPGIIPLDELKRRGEAYSGLEGRFIKVGAPVVGKSGSLLNQWVLPRSGVRREEIFVDNTLRCLPPKNKQGNYYPVKEERREAERCCRVWDRVQEFRPEFVEITLHPAGILREVTPLPLLLKDAEKWVSVGRQGKKALLLMGGKAAETFLGYGDNVTRWRGHYEVVDSSWYQRVLERVEGVKKKKQSGGKVAKINSGVDGFEVFETPSLKRPGFKKPRAKRRKRCGECGELYLGEHQCRRG